MKSKAQLFGHPIHPMLISFPIAFLTGALAFDLAGRFGGWPNVWTTGGYLSIAAVVSGLIAAVPGLIDYWLVIPPDSSAKTRGTQHMLVNGLALAMFAGGWFFRDRDNFYPGWSTLALEGMGVALVSVGGWLGGTLVFRNQIGVDHRYADAGRWSDERVTADRDGSIVAARIDELKPGQMKLVHVGDRRIVLARTDEGWFAFDDRCTHKGASLADGALVCDGVQCPWHGSQFDVRTGEVKAGPAIDPVATHRVEVVDGLVRLSPTRTA